MPSSSNPRELSIISMVALAESGRTRSSRSKVNFVGLTSSLRCLLLQRLHLHQLPALGCHEA